MDQSRRGVAVGRVTMGIPVDVPNMFLGLVNVAQKLKNTLQPVYVHVQPNLRLEFHQAKCPRGTHHPGNFPVDVPKIFLGMANVAQELWNTLQLVYVHVHVDTVEWHSK